MTQTCHANQKSHGPLVVFWRKVTNTFMKSQNTIHETITHSPAGRVLWLHSLYFVISLMYLNPSPKYNSWTMGFHIEHYSFFTFSIICTLQQVEYCWMNQWNECSTISNSFQREIELISTFNTSANQCFRVEFLDTSWWYFGVAKFLFN